ncbi:MAG: large subunit ribosomal protein L31e [Archaeoglobi archaeon]|nr:50S ribosomal protein L31e [Candidatus Mnemosynella bozhongmuii]MDI3502533.1 large subunit ribosomal protein L31e [Archaeoglobi archaeon]MDK2781821.1 large subunit ribosomal protein L31e [Archaeoglobi archaeon]
MEERIYTIPLRRKVQTVPRWRRSEKAVKVVREFLAKHMKAEIDKVKIDESINKKIWERGSQKPPARIRVRAVKFDDGVVEAELVKE